MAAIERSRGETSFIDVLDRVLDKGIVIDGWARVSLIGVDLRTIDGWAGVAARAGAPAGGSVLAAAVSACAGSLAAAAIARTVPLSLSNSPRTIRTSWCS